MQTCVLVGVFYTEPPKIQTILFFVLALVQIELLTCKSHSFVLFKSQSATPSRIEYFIGSHIFQIINEVWHNDMFSIIIDIEKLYIGIIIHRTKNNKILLTKCDRFFFGIVT